MALVNFQEIERLTAKKEKEWKDANSLQLSSLTSALEKKKSECRQSMEMLIQLKKDFKYNLGLLQQRDKELEQYDQVIIRAKTIESAHLAEISDLRIKIAKLTESLKREQQEKCDLQQHYRQQCANHQSSMEMLKTTQEEQLDDVISQLNKMKNSRDRIETQLRAELEAQHFEINAEFDKKFKAIALESKKKAEKMESDVLAHELKCKFLEKELENLKELHKKQDESLEEAERDVSNLRKQLLESENNAKNISTVKNARILDLEAKVQSLIEQKTSVFEEFEEKRKQLDKDVRIKHSNIEVARKNFSDKEKELVQQINKLQLKAEACEQETKRTLLDMQEIQQKHERAIEMFQRRNEDQTIQSEREVESHKAAILSKNVEIENLRQKEILLSTKILQLNEDIKRHERNLADLKQKENLLLQSKVQLKLDLQQKWQEEKGQHDKEMNHIIESLTKSRDEAVAELKTLKTQLSEEVFIQSDDSAITLGRVMELQSQNTQLKDVIEQMSQAMQHAVKQGNDNEEQLDSLKKEGKPGQSVTSEYVASLESQVLHLKKEIRKFQELASMNEQHNAEDGIATKLKVSPSKTARPSDVQKKPQELAQISHDWKMRKKLDVRKQEQYIACALKSPSKAANLINHLQEKLAKAVSQITLLSREKAQLLEIGNSLKSEIGSLRCQRFKTVENEENKHDVLGQTRCQESFEVDRNKLKQLEDLQYQLTKQELQFAQREVHDLGMKQELSHSYTDAKEQSVPTKYDNGDSNAYSNKGVNNLHYSLSTIGDASARNIWSVLDQGTTSPSLPRSDEENNRLNPDRNEPASFERTKFQSRGKRNRVLKIRNYNIKDDEVAGQREDHRR